MNDANFKPIQGSSGYWTRTEEGVINLTESDKEEITELLMGRKVTKADNEHLVLDNGITIKAIGHDGGCACSAGCYDLSVLNGVDNVITNVEFDYQPGGDEYYSVENNPNYEGFYRIFVYADNEKINLMQFDGSDGNGYYGTGYSILVRKAD